MAKRKLSERQQMQTRVARTQTIAKRDDMIQKSRHQLSVREQRCVLYAISKIKPEDTAFSEYTFDIKDFYALCGLDGDSYTELKAMLIGLKSKSWWITIDDKGTESAVSWFNTVHTNKKSGKVTIKFHEDMMPFLLRLTSQDSFYTQYSLQYVLPMSSQYSPRLYELLKSYQKNNRKWYFEVEELKHLLDCQNYDRWPDFRRYALEPAVKEINQYTDLNVAYDTEKEGRRVARITFFLAEKSDDAKLAAEQAGSEVLDGQIDIDALIASMDGDSVEERFNRENPPSRKRGL